MSCGHHVFVLADLATTAIVSVRSFMTSPALRRLVSVAGEAPSVQRPLTPYRNLREAGVNQVTNSPLP
jgi:hypothetical protein